MNKEFEAICKEILENKEEAQKLAELQTPEEMYAYFKAKMPSLSEEEFDSCIAEALEAYSYASETQPELVTELLGEVSGGSGLQKLSKKLMSGALALTAIAPAAMATDGQRSSTPTVGSVAVSSSSQQGVMAKIKRWVKNHKTVSILLGAAATAGLTLLIEHQVVNRFRKTDDKEKEPVSPKIQELVDAMFADEEFKKQIDDQEALKQLKENIETAKNNLKTQIPKINNKLKTHLVNQPDVLKIDATTGLVSVVEGFENIKITKGQKAAYDQSVEDTLTKDAIFEALSEVRQTPDPLSVSFGKAVDAYLAKHGEIRFNTQENIQFIQTASGKFISSDKYKETYDQYIALNKNTASLLNDGIYEKLCNIPEAADE